MGITIAGDAIVGPPATPDGAPGTDEVWFRPSADPSDRGFNRALRAASGAWHPAWNEPPVAPIEEVATVALPVVLSAWRAVERELSGMSADSPERAVLEANSSMLRAMYQRLYVERTRK